MENTMNIKFPKEDWKYEVSNGDTNLGYEKWCEHKRDELSTELQDIDIKITMSEQAWYDLAFQKQALLETFQYLTPEKANRIQGLLNLIDVIQDQAVDTYKIPADIVFPFSE